MFSLQSDVYKLNSDCSSGLIYKENVIEEDQNDIKNSNKRLKLSNNVNVFDNSDQFNCNINPEDVIICEKQERLFCGRHALRALLQNMEMFDDVYLTNLARELANQESLIHQDSFTFEQFYFHNIDGFYHIHVIEKALQHLCNIQLVQINKREEILDSWRNLIIDNIYNVQALFVHQRDHYFCLRRFDSTPDYFFIIDSLRPHRHHTIERNAIKNYIKYLEEKHSSIYVPVCTDILNQQTISPDLLLSLIHPLPICLADEIILDVNCSINFSSY